MTWGFWGQVGVGWDTQGSCSPLTSLGSWDDSVWDSSAGFCCGPSAYWPWDPQQKQAVQVLSTLICSFHYFLKLWLRWGSAAAHGILTAAQGSAVVVLRFSCSMAHGTLVPPLKGIKPVCPAREGGFSITGPLGKPLSTFAFSYAPRRLVGSY